ncbi:hypothetical protein GPECTOR_43g924 [Gonium pectorale]|uniref:Uncharacterized protein n=1 Tax=Gonium pectorale TaxID=33097 RepID=A0A150G9I2_GONPE|nr:hypothetical protein GPECTOR_43g924 [Gonium pectorale]|eukprot:KXZ46488.1 hypothetical protein GPECTOR_43g924 [Gonium pectorale]
MADPQLTAWCERHGIVLNGIAAGFVEEGWRGIVATRDLQAGEVVLRVPERLLLTSRSARRDPQLSAALLEAGAAAASGSTPPTPPPSPPDGVLTPQQLLACHLLHEVAKGAGSFWAPYLRQLPRSYTSLPNFAPEDAAALQLRSAVEAAEAAAEAAREEWRRALPVLQRLGLPKRFTQLRAWLWAASTLGSRTMYLPWCPAGALTPYGDLHNYQPPPAPFTPQLGGPPAPAAGPDDRTLDGATVVAAAGPATAAERSRAAPVPPAALEPHRPCGAGSIGDGGSDRGRGAVGGDVDNVPARGGKSRDGLPAGESYAARVSEKAAGAAADTTSSGGNRSQSLEQAGVRAGGATGASDGGAPAASGTAGPGPAGSDGGGASPAEAATAAPPAAAVTAATEEGGEAAVRSADGRSGSDDGAAEASDGIAGDGMWDEQGQQYCIVVRRPYRAGEQVFLCYGRHTNLELLEHYGFVLEDNPHDTALLDPELLLQQLPPAALAAAAAHGLDPPPPAAECSLHADGAPSWQLLRLLRFCAATPAERRSGGHLMAAGERVSEQVKGQTGPYGKVCIHD